MLPAARARTGASTPNHPDLGVKGLGLKGLGFRGLGFRVQNLQV